MHALRIQGYIDNDIRCYLSSSVTSTAEGVCQRISGRRSSTDRLLSQSRELLESFHAPDGSAERQGNTGSGQAAGGRVRATASNGRLRALQIDPQLRRLPSQELAGHVLAAVKRGPGRSGHQSAVSFRHYAD